MMKILSLYNEVFDEKGEVVNCGREKCKELMHECEEITGRKGDFGDMETGMMNIKAIKKCINIIKGE